MRELCRVFAAARLRQQDAYNLTVATAWYGEVFARQKRLKPLKQYLITEPSEMTADGPMTTEKARVFIHALADRYKGRIVKVTH